MCLLLFTSVSFTPLCLHLSQRMTSNYVYISPKRVKLGEKLKITMLFNNLFTFETSVISLLPLNSAILCYVACLCLWMFTRVYAQCTLKTTKDPNPHVLCLAVLLLQPWIQFHCRFETSLPGLVKTPTEVVCCLCVLPFLCGCLDFACMLIFWSAMVDGSLAEWLTTSWGALWWRYQSCCVTFCRHWLSWHLETRQNAASLSWIMFGVQKTHLPLNFYF